MSSKQSDKKMLLPGLKLHLHPKEKGLPSWFGDPTSEVQFPCFVANGTHRFKDAVEYYAEAYQFYFKDNYAIGLGGILPRSRLLGYHPHDVEGLVVLFDKDTKEPKHVYYKAHGLGQGEWRTWEECEKTEEGFLIAFVAVGSHAMYPACEPIRRIWGFANDYVSREGLVLSIPQSNSVEAKDHQFAKGIEMCNKVPEISNLNITVRQRICFPFLRSCIRRRAKASLKFN